MDYKILKHSLYQTVILKSDFKAAKIRMDFQIRKGRAIPDPAFDVLYLKQDLKLLVSYPSFRRCFFLRSKAKKINKKVRKETMVTVKAL